MIETVAGLLYREEEEVLSSLAHNGWLKAEDEVRKVEENGKFESGGEDIVAWDFLCDRNLLFPTIV